MHRWTHWRLPCFVHTVCCIVTCTVGQTGRFFVFLYTLFAAVFRAPFDKLVFSLFLYILFDALLYAPLDKLAFSAFLYILFDPLLHAQLDTLVFSLFCTHCLIQCYMHRWTHWCFPCFVHSVLCSVTCTFGHSGVFRICVHTV